MKKKLGKKLVLRKETVRELDDNAIRPVAGGKTVSTPGCICLNTKVGCDDTLAFGCP